MNWYLVKINFVMRDWSYVRNVKGGFDGQKSAELFAREFCTQVWRINPKSCNFTTALAKYLIKQFQELRIISSFNSPAFICSATQ